jgi:hypothetical protein
MGGVTASDGYGCIWSWLQFCRILIPHWFLYHGVAAKCRGRTEVDRINEVEISHIISFRFLRQRALPYQPGASGTSPSLRWIRSNSTMCCLDKPCYNNDLHAKAVISKYSPLQTVVNAHRRSSHFFKKAKPKTLQLLAPQSLLQYSPHPRTCHPGPDTILPHSYLDL